MSRARSRFAPLLLLAGACARAQPEPGADIGHRLTGRLDLTAPGVCEAVEGGLRAGRDAWLTRWFGRESAADAPPLLGEERPALQVGAPSRLRVRLEAADGARIFTASVRRERPDAGPELRAEVFWEDDTGLRSLAAAKLAPEEDSWIALRAEAPASAGSLWLVARAAHPALAAQAGGALAWGSPVLAPAAPPDLPDVVCLTVDTLRADALAHMPYLSSLLAGMEGSREAVAPSNWTLPSFGSLWTGLDADRHGAGRGPFAPEPAPGPEARAFTELGPARSFPESLREAGWATACVHQNPFLESWTGLARGFEAWMRTADAPAANRAPAEAWWREQAHRPRFLVLHWMAPHLPYGADGDAADPLAARDWRAFLGEDRTPAERSSFFALAPAERAAVRARYEAEAAALDRELADWLPPLLSSARRPIVLFYSDHGEELWDAGSFEHGHAFEPCLIRVPAGLLRPGATAAGRAAGAVAAGHLGLHLLHRLAEGEPRAAGALRAAADGLPRCGFMAGCPAAGAPIRSTSPLYRSAHDGVEIGRDGAARFLPFTGAGSGGAAPGLDPEVARRLAELGY